MNQEDVNFTPLKEYIQATNTYKHTQTQTTRLRAYMLKYMHAYTHMYAHSRTHTHAHTHSHVRRR